MISYMINQIFHKKGGLIPCSHACSSVIPIPQMCTNGTVGFSSAFEERANTSGQSNLPCEIITQEYTLHLLAPNFFIIMSLKGLFL